MVCDSLIFYPNLPYNFIATIMKQMILEATPTVLDWHFPNMPAHRAQEGDTDNETSPQADVLVAEPEVAKPPMYAVVMYNDNYTLWSLWSMFYSRNSVIVWIQQLKLC